MSEEIEGLNRRRLRKGHPEYDEAKQKELDRRVSDWRKARAEGDKWRFKEAWALEVIKDGKLHIQDGFGDFREWAHAKLRIPPTTLDRRLLLAKTYSESFVVKHGDEKVRLAIEYANRTLDNDDSLDVEGLVFKVPGANGDIAEMTFLEATEADISAAVTHQRSLAASRAAHGLAPEQREKLAVVTEALMIPGIERPLATLSGRRAPSGLQEDAMIRLDFRYGDLDALLERIARLRAPLRRSRGR